MVWNHNDFFFLHHAQVLLGFGRLQALYRSRQLAQQYEATRARIIRFQAVCRGYLLRQKVAKQKKAARVIQAYARGMIARQTYRRIKGEVMLTDTLRRHCDFITSKRCVNIALGGDINFGIFYLELLPSTKVEC